MRSTTKTRHLGVLLAALLLLGVACGDDDGADEDAGRDPTGPAEVTAGRGPQPPVTLPEGEPTPGGKLTYAIEAETDGWNPTRSRWALSGTLVAGAFYDPLAAFDADGNVQPYLAESFDHNEDYTEWTIGLRDGVRFHDGTPLTAQIVADLLNAHRDSGLTGPAVRPLQEAVATDDTTVTVTMSNPWVVFPTVLVGQGGMVPHPDVFDAQDPAALAEPLGTGPFVVEEWVPNNRLVVTRNPDYWQENRPYLDEIEFRVVEDFTSRSSALRAGDINMMHTTDEASIDAFRQDSREGSFQIVEDQGENEELFIILNTAVPPLDDIRVRRALAHATDRQSAADIFAAGVYQVADGPYAPDSPWYAEHDYPDLDVAEATLLVDEYEQETGQEVTIQLRAAGVNNLEIISLIGEQWSQAGIETDLEVVDQPTLVLNGITGDYQAQLWRQHSGPDPDTEWHWWHGSNAAPPGEIALNFTRNNDPLLDDALDTGRSNPDPVVRAEAYATVQQQFGENVPIVWLYHAIVAIVADPTVRGITNSELPDGSPSLPIGGSFSGVHRFADIWLSTN